MRSSSDPLGPGGRNEVPSSSAQDQDRPRDLGGGRGELTVVGLGPGDSGLLAPLALAAIERAEVLAGYGPYLDLIDPALRASRETLSSGMTREVERVEAALNAALSGKRVALVSSGDAGVYGMAGLALEMAEARALLAPTSPDGQSGLRVEVVPGIPAFVAAAAILGAPLMHDFCAVSLSDLLTPAEVIRNRVRCAAEGDFVTALYNPRSKRRASLLEEAFGVFAAYRPPSTPVGMVKNAYRDGQEVRVTPLAEADPEFADMLTIVLVGSSATRFLPDGRVLTPRGYSGKYRLDSRP